MHSFCVLHSQVKLYHLITILCSHLHSGESTRNITAVWYLDACGYCSEAGVFCVVVDLYVGVLGAVCCEGLWRVLCGGGSLCWSARGCLLLEEGREGFYGCGSSQGCQRLRSGIQLGFRLSGCLRQTLCGCEIFQVCLGGLLLHGNAVSALWKE